MEYQDLSRIETLLQTIVDGLHRARTDREFEGASGSGSDTADCSGREHTIRRFEHMRAALEKSA
jgi:hypothetical protein